MDDRFLSYEQVQTALVEGDKQAENESDLSGQDFRVDWRKWTLKVTRQPCTIVLWTAYLSG